MASISSLRMPIPVSAIWIFKITSSVLHSSPCTDKVTDPSSVYFTALSRIFNTTCLILFSSPNRTEGRFLSISRLSSRFFFSACPRISSAKLTNNSFVLYETGIICILFISICDKSSISFT